MEDTEKSKLEEMLTCPVCQDIFKDPRQLACGHSLCMGCLEGLMDHSADTALFRCPDCRADCGPVIGVQRSYALANIAEDVRLNKKRRDEQRKGVYCGFCPEKTTLAYKTCLKCEVSLCQEHIKDHLELPVFTGHPLVRPLYDILERKCPQHEDDVLRYYCSASRRYICNLCALESKQQNLAAEASTVLRRQLTDYMDQHFQMLREQITESSESVKRLQEDLQHEKHKVNPTMSSLNSVTVVLLCLWFIVLYYAYNYSMENQTLTEALEKEKNSGHHLYSSIAGKKGDHGRRLERRQPKQRVQRHLELLVDHPMRSHKCQKTEDPGLSMLDQDTASPFLKVSADLQTVERVKTKLDYPNSNSRFDKAPQILTAQCFSSGTHIWVVEAEGYWDITVSYKSIKRKTKFSSTFGNNAESWSLTHNSKGRLFAYHNKRKTAVSGTLLSNRIAVIVNFKKGVIIFITVESTITQLHEFQARLTQPVCLGVGLYHVDPPSRASVIKVL